MKKIILPSLLLFVLYTTFSSCNKDTQVTKTITDTLNKTITDTVDKTITDTVDTAVAHLTAIQILTGHTWEVSESYASISGIDYYYQRGVSNNFPTILDAERLTFNVNGTGTYTDPNSAMYNLYLGI